jgi:hypothetical protein
MDMSTLQQGESWIESPLRGMPEVERSVEVEKCLLHQEIMGTISHFLLLFIRF